jgi:hypothetical protein
MVCFLKTHPYTAVLFNGLGYKSRPKPAPRNIIFFHQDLGIGGAERLIIDAAFGLQNLGHKVTIFTSHCDPRPCFDETRGGVLDVRIRGNTLIPPSLFLRFSILCAITSQLHLLLSISVFSNELELLKPDIIFVDQLSAGLLKCTGLSLMESHQKLWNYSQLHHHLRKADI